MKVLVTGAGGFIGSHLCEALLKEGYEVKAFVKYNSRNFWGWLEKLSYKKQIEVIAGDIRDYDSVKNAMKDIDIIFHLAALVGIPYSYISPLAYIKTNIQGTYNVLQAARELKVKKIIHTSTSEVYGTAQYIPIDEKHPLNPQSPYAATKASADNLALSFYRSFGLPVIIVRPFNTYGPRQSARAIIPTIITQILSERKNIALGNLHPRRDLTFVEDVAEGFLQISKSDNVIGEVINIGMNKEISIEDLGKMIAELMVVKVNFIMDKQRVRPEKSEVLCLRCDNSKLLANTKWQPKYSLKKGLLKTIRWIEKNLNIYKTEIYNV